MIDTSWAFTMHVGYIHSLSPVLRTFFNQEVARQAQLIFQCQALALCTLQPAGFDIPVGSPGGATVSSRVPGKIPGTPPGIFRKKLAQVWDCPRGRQPWSSGQPREFSTFSRLKGDGSDIREHPGRWAPGFSSTRHCNIWHY